MQTHNTESLCLLQISPRAGSIQGESGNANQPNLIPVFGFAAAPDLQTRSAIPALPFSQLDRRDILGGVGNGLPLGAFAMQQPQQASGSGAGNLISNEIQTRGFPYAEMAQATVNLPEAKQFAASQPFVRGLANGPGSGSADGQFGSMNDAQMQMMRRFASMNPMMAFYPGLYQMALGQGS